MIEKVSRPLKCHSKIGGWGGGGGGGSGRHTYIWIHDPCFGMHMQGNDYEQALGETLYNNLIMSKRLVNP